MIKMGIDPDNKAKYIKLTKHVIIATVLITISLTLIEIPKYYFGSSVEVTDGQVSDMTIGKIEDADCQGRETINIDGRRYVVTDINVKLSALKDNQAFIKVIQTSNELGERQLQNCSILRAFSECQGAFKGYIQKFINNAFTIVIQLLLVQFAIILLNGGHFVLAFTTSSIALRTPTMLQEFMISSGGGSTSGKVNTVSRVVTMFRSGVSKGK